MKLLSEKQAFFCSFFLTLFFLLLLLPLKLFACFFAAFLIYEIINIITPLIERLLHSARARLVTTFVVAAALVIFLAFSISALIIYLLHSLEDVVSLQYQLELIIEDTYRSFAAYFPGQFSFSEADLKEKTLGWVKDNLTVLRGIGQNIAAISTNIVIGLLIGLLVSVHHSASPNPNAVLRNQLIARAENLVVAFRNLVFAQVKISLINSILTGIFLLLVMPLFSVHLPFVKTLIVLTFVLGMLPVIGNLISNSIIFVAAFSVSPLVAATVLLYLIVIHKLEYFLNAKIIGNKIQASAWELLIAMFLFQAMFGIAGMIAAPIYYAYLKRELTAFGLI